MDIEALHVFASVVRLGTFAAVARQNDTDPSTISRIISSIEAELGFRLFQRTTRHMTLTESGQVYFSRIEALLEDLEIAREEALEVTLQPKGTMRITASHAFGQFYLVPLLPHMRSRFPDLKFDLVITDLPVDLVTERIDLAIRFGQRVEGDLIATRFFDMEYKVCASPDYIERHGNIDVPQDLEKHRCLLFHAQNFQQSWFAQDGQGKKTELSVTGDIIMSSLMALRLCAIEGLGPVLLTSWMVEQDIAAGRLVELLPEFKMSGAHVQPTAWLVYPSRRHLPYKVRVVIDFLKEYAPHSS
jgi:DNA-binding transcriptional LysR family regulator